MGHTYVKATFHSQFAEGKEGVDPKDFSAV
ncbi:MAG: hypothetical protein DDT24_00826 [Chloroflexi bacterium]|nr:hypothetical protein [Chloroflexota bacterium]MBT9166507.1 hypothetical protein [Chloroflexota bacterium]